LTSLRTKFSAFTGTGRNFQSSFENIWTRKTWWKLIFNPPKGRNGGTAILYNERRWSMREKEKAQNIRENYITATRANLYRENNWANHQNRKTIFSMVVWSIKEELIINSRKLVKIGNKNDEEASSNPEQ
jgi:hypothetical protein